ncbi:hypothetical protein [Bradyrhizobium sp. AZCC 2289]|uniref:hypothetical protein n=1 Tax=Bradyrhizobium sp. AZCC 2289 TaxID=3117026 RepID=UPI002FF20DB0
MDDAIVLPIFMATVYLSRVNLNTVHRRNPGTGRGEALSLLSDAISSRDPAAAPDRSRGGFR